MFDRYNFTVKEDEPLEKEVAIDPELLGKAYEKFNAIRPDNFEDYTAALKSGQKGAENRFNKKFGVYYTPREIVHYMCQQSLIHYLDAELNLEAASYQNFGEAQTDAFGNLVKSGQFTLAIEHRPSPEIPLADLETLVACGDRVGENEAVVQARGRETRAYSYQLPESIRQNAERIDRALAKITVCDPAIGSGAFPVGMLHEIVRTRNALSPFLQDPQRTIYRLKREYIEHSLYGVDIDPGAAEIAKLRLWLSLVVDEDDIRQIKPLPNLDYKIVCGNSLVGFPANWTSPITREIEALKQAFFDETNPTRKQELRTQINEKIQARYQDSYKTFGYEVSFDFRTVFSEVFREKGGFDVVIANPPYVRQEKLKDDKPYFQKQYKVYQGTADLYVYFYEKGLQILKSHGILSYISSNKFMRTNYGRPLRKFLRQEFTLRTVIDFGDLPVFEATAYPAILVLKNRKPTPDHTLQALCVEKIEDVNHLAEIVREYAWFQPQSRLEIERWNFVRSATHNLLQKLQQQGISIEKYTKGNIYRGIITGLNKAFVIDQCLRDKLISQNPQNNDIIKPWLIGKNVKRWNIEKQNLYLIAIQSSGDKGCSHPWKNANSEEEARQIFRQTYPAIHDHLTQYEEALRIRQDQGKFWWELRACKYYAEFKKSKIVYPNICKQPEFALDSEGFYTNQKCFIISLADQYLLGVLNSSVTFFLFRQMLPKLRGDFYEPGYVFFKDFPIAEPTPDQRAAIETLVDRILAAKQRDPAVDTRALQAEIDRLVYQLYGLTAEDIRIVEGREP